MDLRAFRSCRLSHQCDGPNAVEMRRGPCSFEEGLRERSYQDITETSDMPWVVPGSHADVFENHFGFLEKACQLPLVA